MSVAVTQINQSWPTVAYAWSVTGLATGKNTITLPGVEPGFTPNELFAYAVLIANPSQTVTVNYAETTLIVNPSDATELIVDLWVGSGGDTDHVVVYVN